MTIGSGFCCWFVVKWALAAGHEANHDGFAGGGIVRRLPMNSVTMFTFCAFLDVATLSLAIILPGADAPCGITCRRAVPAPASTLSRSHNF